ncbi:hypothetical protein IE81DRAFT_320532 [Ceraceosorus guamensis]|uniref:Zn(2)-C6 fungal-type domain-containing protein n=1 Tax=Ceraceosorus guamensis TaxID=1522189 RepID=A0A316WCS5_9BASI|nr:hypothetical protein IE81DRAFT_320532 [Ceraceosorus guamensis]PWN45335.1 hypothetical protein IE81DRAFT_320532 [Ceraceosorus guamensis]
MESRRSCAFCRARKLRCSGETPWCDKCAEREQTCIYELVNTTRAGARPSMEAHTSSPFESGYSPHTSAPTAPAKRKKVSTTPKASSRARSIGDVCDERAGDLQKYEYCAAAAVDDGHSELGVLAQSLEAPIGEWLLVMASVSIWLTASQHSSMVPQNESVLGLRQGISARLWVPDAKPGQKATDPASTITSSLKVELVNAAFAQHPILSLLVNKTILQRDMHDGNAERNLVNAILAEGIGLTLTVQDRSVEYMNGEALPSPSMLAEDAEAEVRLSDASSAARAFTSAQVIVLLAWRSLRLDQLGHAVILLSVASDLLSWLVNERRLRPASHMVRINGVDVKEVEADLIDNMRWICHLAQTFFKSTLGHDTVTPRQGLVAALEPSALPKASAQESSGYLLDRIAGCFATLPSHSDQISALYTAAQALDLAKATILPGTSAANRGHQLANLRNAYAEHVIRAEGLLEPRYSLAVTNTYQALATSLVTPVEEEEEYAGSEVLSATSRINSLHTILSEVSQSRVARHGQTRLEGGPLGVRGRGLAATMRWLTLMTAAPFCLSMMRSNLSLPSEDLALLKRSAAEVSRAEAAELTVAQTSALVHRQEDIRRVLGLDEVMARVTPQVGESEPYTQRTRDRASRSPDGNSNHLTSRWTSSAEQSRGTAPSSYQISASAFTRSSPPSQPITLTSTSLGKRPFSPAKEFEYTPIHRVTLSQDRFEQSQQSESSALEGQHFSQSQSQRSPRWRASSPSQRSSPPLAPPPHVWRRAESSVQGGNISAIRMVEDQSTANCLDAARSASSSAYADLPTSSLSRPQVQSMFANSNRNGKLSRARERTRSRDAPPASHQPSTHRSTPSPPLRTLNRFDPIVETQLSSSAASSSQTDQRREEGVWHDSLGDFV